MRLALLILPLLGGCNAIFGLDPTSLAGGDDAAVDTDGGAGDDAGRTVDANPAMTGRIWAMNADYTTGVMTAEAYEATARFGPPTEACSHLEEVGGCSAEQCAAVPPTVPAPHTGTITIDAQNLAVLVPSPDGLYPPMSNSTTGLFDGGITIGVYSDGDTIPAVSATLVSPPVVTITSPPLPSATQPGIITRGSGLDLTWAAASTTIHVIVADVDGTRVTCDLPASAGTGSVPPKVLEQLTAGPGSFWAYTVEREPTVAGDYDVQVIAAQAVLRADGDWARGSVSLQ